MAFVPFFIACSDDDDGTGGNNNPDTGEDLASQVVGEYVGQITGGTGGFTAPDYSVTIEKVSNNTVRIRPTSGSNSKEWEQVIIKPDNFEVTQRFENEEGASIELFFFFASGTTMRYKNAGEDFNGLRQ